MIKMLQWPSGNHPKYFVTMKPNVMKLKNINKYSHKSKSTSWNSLHEVGHALAAWWNLKNIVPGGGLERGIFLVTALGLSFFNDNVNSNIERVTSELQFYFSKLALKLSSFLNYKPGIKLPKTEICFFFVYCSFHETYKYWQACFYFSFSFFLTSF